MKIELASSLVLGVLLSLCSPGAAAAQTRPVSLISTGSGVIVIVDITVGGSTRHLLLDTGATITVLSPETAGWSPADAVRSASHHSIVGLGGGAHSMGTTTAALDFGQTVVVTQAAVAELTDLSKALHIELGGILGQDVLFQFARITIDYKHKQMILEK
jgi:predicted aspartyl protease